MNRDLQLMLGWSSARGLVAVLAVTLLIGRIARSAAWIWLPLLHAATLAKGSQYLLDLVASDALGLTLWRLTPVGAST